jgi:hypothetical protein
MLYALLTTHQEVVEMKTPTKRISTEAYQALREALPVIVWYKRTYSRYLRTALRAHPEVIRDLDFSMTKREVADELIDRLIDEEDKYQEATLRLMMEIANMTAFPELEGLEDRDIHVPRAEHAVAELRRHTEAHEALIFEQERQSAEREARRQQEELRRRFSDELGELKQRYMKMSVDTAAGPQQRGRDFERFLFDLFDLFDLEPRFSYSLEREQVDGAFHFHTDDYTLEAKWTSTAIERSILDIFKTRVGDKGKNALGLFVSVNGFSKGAIDQYSRGTPFITMDGADLYAVLDQRVSLDDLLGRKRRHANETGECFYPAHRMF